jgi:sterol desaturase/sphingolipid hydroxylase (fatty acid hydroxylase superfamily)
VEEISGSNILRIYKFQVYESSFIERMVDAVVQNFSFAGTLIGFLSYIIGVLAMVPGYEKVLNPALAVIVSVVIIQASVSGWGHSIANRMLFLRTSSIKKDIFCALLSGLGYLSIFTTIYSLGLDRVITWISDFAVNRLHSYSINIDTGLVVIDIVLYLLAFTFVDYWQHRITHTSILWPLHRFHHSGSEFNGLTVFRNHPATFATDPVLRLALLAFLPMPARVSEYWPIVSLLFWSHQMLTHTDVDWKFGWIGKWIFVSPALHKVHHSKESEHYNKNFGTLFTVWDHVFGTYHEVPTARIEMGLTGEGDAISKKWIIWEWMIDVKNLFTGRYLRSVSWSARASFLKP